MWNWQKQHRRWSNLSQKYQENRHSTSEGWLFVLSLAFWVVYGRYIPLKVLVKRKINLLIILYPCIPNKECGDTGKVKGCVRKCFGM